MARKRRDKERDPSSSERLLKAGKTALAIGAGAVFLNNTNSVDKFKRQVVPALLKTQENIKKDLVGKDKRSLLTWGKIYDNHLTSKEFKKTMLLKSEDKMKINAMTSSGYKKLLTRQQVLDGKSLGSFASEIKGHYEQQVLNKAVENILQEHIIPNEKYSHITRKNIEQIVQDTHKIVTESSIKDKLPEQKIPKTLKALNLSDEDKTSILSTLLESIKDKDEKIKAYSKHHQTLLDDVREVYDKANFDKHNKTKYQKFDNFAKKLLGVNINSEKLITGSQAVTAKEFVNNFEEIQKHVDVSDFRYIKNKKDKKDNYLGKFNFVEQLKDLLEKNEDAGDLVISKGLRKKVDKNGNVSYFSSQDSIEFLDNIHSKLKETLPYKILARPFDLNKNTKKPDIYIGKSNKKSSLLKHKKLNGLESVTELENIEDNITSSLTFYINGRAYFTNNDNGTLTLDKENYVKAKLLDGYQKKEYYNIVGESDWIIPEKYDSFLAKILDINQRGEFNHLNKFKRALHKYEDPNWEFHSISSVENIYTSGVNPGFYIQNAVETSLTENEYNDVNTRTQKYMQIANKLHVDEIITSKKLGENIKGVTNNTMEALLENDYIEEKHKKMLLALKDEDIFGFLDVVTGESDSKTLSDFKNDNLNVLVNKWFNNTQEMIYSNKEIRNKGYRLPIIEMPFDESVQLNPVGQLKVELVKEIMLTLGENSSEDVLFNWINDLNLSPKDSYALKDLSVSALFDDAAKIFAVDSYTENVGKLYDTENTLVDLLADNPALRSHFEANLGTIKSSFGPLSKGSNYNIGELFYNEQDKYAIVKQSSIGEILTFDINNQIKFNSQALIDTAKEFVAGRSNLENMTELTILTQSLLTRWNYGVQELGFGLSSESLGGPLDTLKNITLKRVLPLVAAGKTLDLLNYEAEKITGTSLIGATANAFANIDMGARKIIDGTLLNTPLNYLAETSVIAEYYTGDRKFKTAEEEREWYQDGYSPVRKGRFWSFGSSSEFRGGSITYFQPNYLKRAHSNYHDISVYGSSDEKWAHSWIPTPQHPLSTVRAFLDPYWLEKKHLKDNDRPYPLTGKMFSEGSFWGSVLNPTVGEILKPVKMLPEARKRLGNDGVDAKATIEKLNTKIKQRGNNKDDLLVVEGSDIRNAEYVSYGNPESNELNVSFSNGKAVVKGENFMESVPELNDYEAPNGLTYTEKVDNFSNDAKVRQKRILTKGEKFFTEMKKNEYGTNASGDLGLQLVSSMNDRIKNKDVLNNNRDNNILVSPDKNEGTFIYRNLVNERNNYIDKYYSNKDTKNMVNKSIGYDYARDFMYSQKQLHGIYGFLGDQFFGSNTYTYRYENAGKMSSFSRRYWDQGLGGLGGGFMEIARRFFPSEDKSRVNINPLRNNMPDWIPESYHFGDPYTEIPKGEMRLPGKGYESLNQLHPDEFGEYGSFDRYKILADIAPNSAEFKKWKSIAKNTVTDEKLKKQIEDINVRVAKMSGNHEFYNYNYIKTNTEFRKGVVKGFNSDGQITLIDNTNLTLAGITPGEDINYGLAHLLKPGEEITYKTYKDAKVGDDGQAVIDSVVYSIGKNATNINQELISLGVAEKDKTDFSPLAVTGKQDGIQEILGAAQEIVAHAKIPIIHNKFLKVETPLESYKAENYYGSNFKTWDHPIKGFISPAFNEQSGKSLTNQALSLGYAYLHFTKVAGHTDSKTLTYASNVLLTTLNPSAFVGGALGYGSRLSLGNMVSSGGSSYSDFQKGALIGTTIGAVRWGWDNADNPLLAASSFALAGATTSKIFKDITQFAQERISKDISKVGTKEMALIGAAIGLGVSAIKNPDFDTERMFTKWTPKETKKKWELDEYFDRLNYIKYKGLYQVASLRADIFEHSNIRQIFNAIDDNKKEIAKLNRKANKVMNKKNPTHWKNQSELQEINERKNTLIEQNKVFLQGDKYTKAAVAYKKKMESTIYGLDETATKDELLASVPDQYKDHFKAFMETTNKKEQKEILKYIPEYLQRPLQIAWGEKPNKVKSNRMYFKNHKLPSMAWKGWKPNVNMKHVKMKTIQNEGMIMSDFGYYESEKSKASYENAPSIKDYDKKSSQFYRTNLMGSLNGLGVSVSNVSVEPTSAPGVWVVGDVKDTASDLMKVSNYKLNTMIQSISNSIF